MNSNIFKVSVNYLAMPSRAAFSNFLEFGSFKILKNMANMVFVTSVRQ